VSCAAPTILHSAAAFFGSELDGRHPRCPSSSRPTVSAGESNRSAACCSSPALRTTPPPADPPRRGGSGTSSSSPRSPGSGRRTAGCTAPTRCGRSSAGRTPHGALRRTLRGALHRGTADALPGHPWGGPRQDGPDHRGPEGLHEPPAHSRPGVTRATLQGRDVVLADGQAVGELALGQTVRSPPLRQVGGPDANLDGISWCHWASIRQDSRSVVANLRPSSPSFRAPRAAPRSSCVWPPTWSPAPAGSAGPDRSDSAARTTTPGMTSRAKRAATSPRSQGAGCPSYATVSE